MSAVVALDSLLASRRLWRGQPATQAPADAVSTGWAALDAALPGGGWPAAALSEILLPADGVGELRLVWPALARLARGDGIIAVVAPPYLPYAPAWEAAGIRNESLQVIDATPRDALWASEQCLRSGACRAVLCWPRTADDRALRRLQVAAETGRTPGFAFRAMSAAANPSPAPLRIAIEDSGHGDSGFGNSGLDNRGLGNSRHGTAPHRLRVLKCRGALVPPAPIAFPLNG